MEFMTWHAIEERVMAFKRGDEKKEKKKNLKKKARRWVVERTHSWFNRFRRVLIRWEKKVMKCDAILHFVSSIITFRAAGLFG